MCIRDRLRSDLESQVTSLGIREKVVFAGFQRNVGDYQECIDVCVFASENEPFGLVAVETLSRGKPTLVFKDGGGIIEIVSPVCARDVVDSILNLSERLVDYYGGDPEEPTDVQKRKNRASDFKIESMAKEMDTVYKTLSKVDRS